MARMVYQKMNATVMIEAEFIKKKKIKNKREPFPGLKR
jgi:hypothetical protein